MRALFVVTQTEWVGPSRVLVQAARGLAARGTEVMLACHSGSGVAAHAADGGIELIDLPQRAGLVGTILFLRGALRQWSVDIVFVHTTKEQRAADLARRLASARTVVKRLPTIEALGIDVSAIDAVAPASRVALRAPGEGPLVGCWCGSDAHVAVVYALRALGKLVARHPDLHALMVGPGATDDTLRVHAAALGLHGALSWIPEDGPARSAMRAADIGWVAGEGEDAAFAMLECMAARVPVVTRDEPFARHLLGAGEAGVLINTADAERSAVELAMLLAYPARRARLGDAGRARVEHSFTERAIVDAFAVALPPEEVSASWTAQ